MIVVVKKEVFNHMMPDKTAAFIERNRCRTVPCTNLQREIPVFVAVSHKSYHCVAIALALVFRSHGKAFDFQDALSLVGDNTLCFGNSVFFKNIQGTSLQVSVDHVFLFVRQQEQ